ncbi:MAG TPA: sugar:proton symporter [Actinomycetota bacterium]|jgi:hypothetical protein|nr:sugar:proton symporter [Actinomycetota bacterium]
MAVPPPEPVGPRARYGYRAAVPPRGWSWAGLSMRILFTLAGAAGLIVSAFLDWVSGVEGVELDIRTVWIPQRAYAPTEANFVETMGFAAIVLGLIAIIGLAPRSGWLTRLAGAIGVIGFILFVVQLYRSSGNFDVSDLRLGAWLLLAGSVLALIGGFLGTRVRYVMPPAPAVLQEP